MENGKRPLERPRTIRDQGVAGSNPVAPTNFLRGRSAERGHLAVQFFVVGGAPGVGHGQRGRMCNGRASRAWLAFRFSRMAKGINASDLSPLTASSGQASLEVRVAGRVQGVGFRYFTLEVARRLGLSGYVMNTRDGGVRAYAEGPRESLEEWLRALQHGPGGARVREVRATWGPATGVHLTFTIQPTL